MPLFDPALCLVTDRRLCPTGEFLPRLDAALAAGVTMVQFREKSGLSDREAYQLGLAVRQLCRTYRTPLVINDRLDLAMALEADGLHLGQTDLPLDIARRYWGPGKIYGLSVGHPGEVRLAEAAGADYLGAGAVVATPTKPESPAVGTSGLADIVKESLRPVMAIGGIKPDNIDEFLAVGISGVAVISALWAAPDMAMATKALLKQIRSRLRA